MYGIAFGFKGINQFGNCPELYLRLDTLVESISVGVCEIEIFWKISKMLKYSQKRGCRKKESGSKHPFHFSVPLDA